MSCISVHHPTRHLSGTIALDGSKSISNRVLLIQALCEETFDIHHLSTSDDTRTLQRLLEEESTLDVFDSHHAGTTYRFLTAYLATRSGVQTLTGSDRMLERPIGPLVDALRQMGASIEYLGVEGYPPLRIGEIETQAYQDHVEIDAGISSQYISALMLVAPTLPRGLTIKLQGDLVSESYLQLTMNIMRSFGVEVDYEFPMIKIAPQSYCAQDFTVEADWSAASYYYSLMALCESGELRLEGLSPDSFQGDSVLSEIGSDLGVTSTWEGDQLVLTKCAQAEEFVHGFINCPDIAQTVAVMCAAQHIPNQMSGLQTLKIKETDRIAALHNELQKVGSAFEHVGDEVYSARPVDSDSEETPTFLTYKDHRMAMSFAPLALLREIQIQKPEVVSKSYPNFWRDLSSLGFVMEER